MPRASSPVRTSRCQCGSPISMPATIRSVGNFSRSVAAMYPSTSKLGGAMAVPSDVANFCNWSSCARSPAGISHMAWSTCSVKATAGKPMSTARAHVPSMSPQTASHDHSVWTWLSVGSITRACCHGAPRSPRDSARRRLADTAANRGYRRKPSLQMTKPTTASIKISTMISSHPPGNVMCGG